MFLHWIHGSHSLSWRHPLILNKLIMNLLCQRWSGILLQPASDLKKSIKIHSYVVLLSHGPKFSLFVSSGFWSARSYIQFSFSIAIFSSTRPVTQRNWSARLFLIVQNNDTKSLAVCYHRHHRVPVPRVLDGDPCHICSSWNACHITCHAWHVQRPLEGSDSYVSCTS